MARFVARYAAYSHGVREEIAEQFARGTRVIQKPLEAKFDPRGLTEFEKEKAQAELQFHGLPKDKETDSNVSPVSRMSLFDSEEAQKQNRWTDEEHDLVVNTLRESDRLGLDYIEVDSPKRPAPWASYDKLTDPEQIAELAVATGAPIADVLAYERENENRDDVIEALEEALGESDSDVVVIDASGS